MLSLLVPNGLLAALGSGLLPSSAAAEPLVLGNRSHVSGAVSTLPPGGAAFVASSNGGVAPTSFTGTGLTSSRVRAEGVEPDTDQPCSISE
jgi:hypothetical protein